MNPVTHRLLGPARLAAPASERLFGPARLYGPVID